VVIKDKNNESWIFKRGRVLQPSRIAVAIAALNLDDPRGGPKRGKYSRAVHVSGGQGLHGEPEILDISDLIFFVSNPRIPNVQVR
jgi:hypothetical protein